MGTLEISLDLRFHLKFLPKEDLNLPSFKFRSAVKMNRCFMLLALVLVVVGVVQASFMEEDNQGSYLDMAMRHAMEARASGRIKNNIVGKGYCHLSCLTGCPEECCWYWPKEFTC